LDDLAINEALVRSMLEEQYPDLAGLELREVVGGWGNRMWRLGDDLAVRIPRTQRDAAPLAKEYEWVPRLPEGLPLPVPKPVHLGEGSDRFPHNWTVVTWVAGTPADFEPVEQVEPSAAILAGFLGALHQAAPADAPRDGHRGGPLAPITAHVEKRLATIEEYPAMTSLNAEIPRLREVWADAAAADLWEGPPVWIHGDIHSANALTTGGILSGVIDFGELCVGDPADDLASAWVLLPDGGAEACFAHYPLADESLIRRSRGWAIIRALLQIEVGYSGEMGWAGGKANWKPFGEATLRRLLA
jgi:aminoglycoside phosphotransferase (APT) family kinase protein